MPNTQRVGEVNKVAGTRVWGCFKDLFSQDFLRNLKGWQEKKLKAEYRKKVAAVRTHRQRKIHKRANCTESESSKYNHPSNLFGPTLSVFKSRHWLYLLFLSSCILVCCHQRSNLLV